MLRPRVIEMMKILLTDHDIQDGKKLKSDLEYIAASVMQIGLKPTMVILANTEDKKKSVHRLMKDMKEYLGNDSLGNQIDSLKDPHQHQSDLNLRFLGFLLLDVVQAYKHVLKCHIQQDETAPASTIPDPSLETNGEQGGNDGL